MSLFCPAQGDLELPWFADYPSPFPKSPSDLGFVCNCTRWCTFQHERRARIEAVERSRFQLGKQTTLKRMPYKLERTLLIGKVLNVAVSGVEAHTLTAGDDDALQKPVTKILREAMGKKAVTLEWNDASNKYEVVSQIPNDVVHKYWKVPTIRTVLVTRRIRMCQSMAATPEDCVLPMAAAFGQLQGEIQAGIAPPVVDGYITTTAFAWAKQFVQDMQVWCTADEHIDAVMANVQYRFFKVFENADLKQDSLAGDPTIIQAYEMSNMIPHTQDPADLGFEEQNPPTSCYRYTCPQCAAAFPTHKQLRAHESAKHDIRVVASLLTPTNACPACLTVFASRRSAIQHAGNTLLHGHCTKRRTHNLAIVRTPPRLDL